MYEQVCLASKSQCRQRESALDGSGPPLPRRTSFCFLPFLALSPSTSSLTASPFSSIKSASRSGAANASRTRSSCRHAHKRCKAPVSVTNIPTTLASLSEACARECERSHPGQPQSPIPPKRKAQSRILPLQVSLG
jgi:hypothetical protein